MSGDPFGALGLTAGPGLTDDDIRAAWHRVAAATHPDRADGGDPAAFSAAAAAYSDLRTPFGRGEALAALARPRRPHRPGRAASPAAWPGTALARTAMRRAAGRAGRLRGGRPARLALVVAAGAGASALAVAVNGWQPASVGVIAGAATWVLRTGHRYLAARSPAAGPEAAPDGQP